MDEYERNNIIMEDIFHLVLTVTKNGEYFDTSSIYIYI